MACYRLLALSKGEFDLLQAIIDSKDVGGREGEGEEDKVWASIRKKLRIN